MSDDPNKLHIPQGAQPQDLWREVLQLHQSKGISREDALRNVICEWLLKGEPAPLIAAHNEGEIRDPILSVIVLMLLGHPALDYHLEIKRPPWAPKKAGGLWRDMFMALLYLQRRDAIGADAAFEEVAEHFLVDASTVRRAVRRIRKMSKSSASH